ncbi:Glutathione peroxidase 2 [Naganishia albida]|nr:Glutathione peroxidase 2 [Naganishia albida]
MSAPAQPAQQGWGSFIWTKLGYENLPQDVAQKSFYDLRAPLPGKDRWINMADFKGKVVLIVNTASKCGFTPQYKGLQRLHDEYSDRGLVVIGFPCDQFGGQEPGNDQEIMETCELNHGVNFPLAKKSDVNGANMNEVFAWIKSKKTSLGGTSTVKWNFEKALISKDGQLINRYLSYVKPDSLKPDIEKALAA